LNISVFIKLGFVVGRVRRISGIRNASRFIFSPVFGPGILSHKLVLNWVRGSVFVQYMDHCDLSVSSFLCKSQLAKAMVRPQQAPSA